ILVSLGGISALVPDLDTDGKLRGKMTLSHKRFRSAIRLISLLVIGYSYIAGTGTAQYIGIAAGLVLFSLASSIRSKHMLTLTGIVVAASGFSFSETWLCLFGIYIFIASIVSHRSYTHSIIGVIYFGLIAKELHISL